MKVIKDEFQSKKLYKSNTEKLNYLSKKFNITNGEFTGVLLDYAIENENDIIISHTKDGTKICFLKEI